MPVRPTGEPPRSNAYQGDDGTGFQIGGSGSSVIVSGGMAANGTVSVKSLDANATLPRGGSRR